jgi:hypothetical protein
VHKRTLDAYDRAKITDLEKFWVDLARLETRLLAVTSKKTSSMELKAAEMAYNRGLKRICHDQPT